MAKTPSSYISLLYWERDNFIENGKWLIMIDKVAYNFKNTEGILTIFLVLVIYKAKNAYCIKILIQTKNQ